MPQIYDIKFLLLNINLLCNLIELENNKVIEDKESKKVIRVQIIHLIKQIENMVNNLKFQVGYFSDK